MTWCISLLFTDCCLVTAGFCDYTFLTLSKCATLYRMFSAQAGWTLTHTSHKDTEQSAVEASVTLDSITLTGLLIRWSQNEWPSVCREIKVSASKMFWTSNKPAKSTPYRKRRTTANPMCHTVQLPRLSAWKEGILPRDSVNRDFITCTLLQV
jgi:hypothetical protein